MRSFTLAAILSLIIGASVQAAELTAKDLAPARGDKSAYNITEETSLVMEGTPNKMNIKATGVRNCEVVAAAKGAGTTVFVVYSSQNNKIYKNDGPAEDTPLRYGIETWRTSEDGLYLDTNYSVSNGEENIINLGSTNCDLKLPCQPGVNWTIGKLAFKEGNSMRPQGEATGYESINVPGGYYENCLKVVRSCPNGMEGTMGNDQNKMEIVSSELSTTRWYSPKIGLIKEVSTSVMKIRPQGHPELVPLTISSTTTVELASFTAAGK